MSSYRNNNYCSYYFNSLITTWILCIISSNISTNYISINKITCNCKCEGAKIIISEKKIKLNKEDIINLLPHRDPMLLIDELYDIENLHSAKAVVNVKKSSFFVMIYFLIVKVNF